MLWKTYIYTVDFHVKQPKRMRKLGDSSLLLPPPPFRLPFLLFFSSHGRISLFLSYSLLSAFRARKQRSKWDLQLGEGTRTLLCKTCFKFLNFNYFTSKSQLSSIDHTNSALSRTIFHIYHCNF